MDLHLARRDAGVGVAIERDEIAIGQRVRDILQPLSGLAGAIDRRRRDRLDSGVSLTVGALFMSRMLCRIGSPGAVIPCPIAP
ncbi:hypothetical protein [Sphingopyxis terrae]|uniref:hypothetical protein n=1 Tax=Sphingopyxis terrae TaxID=33052 RepID=UPI003614293B